MKLCWAVLLGLLGCSTPNPNVHVRRLPHGPLQVDGPLLGPFKTVEELATNACTFMTSQPGATAAGPLSIEYCALYYYSVEDEAYFLSYLSTINGDMPSGVKACTVPKELNERNHRTAIILGPAHTHSSARQLSRADMGAGLAPGETPVGPSKVFNEATGRVWERELLMFEQEGKDPCRAYSYNYGTRAVSALRDGAWVPIGEAKGGSGSFKKEGQGPGWPP